MSEKKFKYIIALGFFTNAGVTNDKCGELEQDYEIIQCFSIIFNLETKEIVDEYDKVIRPEKNAIISDQCTELTGVTQLEVDDGIEFYLFMVEYQQWLTSNKVDPYDEENRNFVFATFGEWDLRHILPKQCVLQEMEIPPYFDEWINVERMTYALAGIGGEMNKVMSKLNLPLPSPKPAIEHCRAIISIIRYLLLHSLPISSTSLIDIDGNFIEKDILLPSPPSPPSLSPSSPSSLTLSSSFDRPITKRSKVRGKAPLSPFSSSLSSSPSSQPFIDPSLPLHLLPLVIRKGKDFLKD